MGFFKHFMLEQHDSGFFTKRYLDEVCQRCIDDPTGMQAQAAAKFGTAIFRRRVTSAHGHPPGRSDASGQTERATLVGANDQVREPAYRPGLDDFHVAKPAASDRRQLPSRIGHTRENGTDGVGGTDGPVAHDRGEDDLGLSSKTALNLAENIRFKSSRLREERYQQGRLRIGCRRIHDGGFNLSGGATITS